MEYSLITIDSKVILLGGQHFRDEETGAITLSGDIQAYDAEKDSWITVGTLPYRIKEGSVGYHNGFMYISGGQRDVSHNDPTTAFHFQRSTWKAKLSLGS